MPKIAEYDVVALGELLIDFAGTGSDADGYPALAAHPGGAPGNFLAALARYGARTAFIGKVGEDAFGGMLRKTLADAGIDINGVVSDPEFFTTLAFVTIDSTGDRSFSFARKPGADTQLKFEEINLELLGNTRVFHFGTLSLTDEPARSATIEAVKYAKEHGAMITFDPNLRMPLWRNCDDARREILWGLGQADVVKISGEELEFLWECTPEAGAEKLLREFGVKLAMVTLGADGCYMLNRNGGCRVAAPDLKPVDTTGAGDIFGGSAVSRILAAGVEPENLSVPQLKEIAGFASAAASLSTLKHGGISSIPDIEDVLKMI